MAVQAKGTVRRIYPSYQATNARTYIALELPAAAGVPEIAPPALIDRPFGRLPEVIDQLYGGVPPDAFTDPE